MYLTRSFRMVETLYCPCGPVLLCHHHHQWHRAWRALSGSSTQTSVRVFSRENNQFNNKHSDFNTVFRWDQFWFFALLVIAETFFLMNSTVASLERSHRVTFLDAITSCLMSFMCCFNWSTVNHFFHHSLYKWIWTCQFVTVIDWSIFIMLLISDIKIQIGIWRM